MMSRLILTAMMSLISTTVAVSDDMTGQASNHRRRHVGNSRKPHPALGRDAPESDQLCRGEDSLQYRCGAKAANELDCLYRQAPRKLHPDLAGSIRAHGCDVLSRGR
jgi:hypothetical protein